MYDVIVVGLGAMGSATIYHLAKRGAAVLGIDRFDPPHTLGSSHGESRITRQAVGEGEAYVPLVLRSYDLWRALEEESGQSLLRVTGGYIIGPNDSQGNFHGLPDFVTRTVTIAQKYGIDHELCSAAELRRRLPMFNIRDNEHAYFEPKHALLLPEQIVKAHLDLAQQNGAHLRRNERVLDVAFNATNVTVTTDRHAYIAARAVIAAGSWVSTFLPEAERSTVGVYRQVFYWFEVDDPALFHEARCPWLMWLGGDAEDMFGLFPMVEGGRPGVKLLTEQFHQTSDPDSLARTVQPAEIQDMVDRFLRPRLRGVSDRCLETAVCMYTVTPDRGFILDVHPDSERVLIASPCSGHGFKHSAAIGEALAQLALGGTPTIDIGPFSLARFGD
ncbi:MAG: N-methyl-L-tryptophan oxidase [Anaerolineae bacterium]|nr:N-methyl-L-tryptophan oxidase [Anaerolineae bacterium]